MTDEPLLTLRQVADELGLPESTVRYYRDAFLDHIPSVGTGRRRRYPPPAVAVLRSVAEAYAAGRTREQILSTLDGVAPQPAGVRDPDDKARRARRQPAGISNLELLAAIVDGEREQRDALWQMAKEIVRLTEVLEGQEKVLAEIADHSGVSAAHRPALDAGARPQPRALGEGRAAPAPPAPPPPAAAAAPPPPPPAAPPAPPAPPVPPLETVLVAEARAAWQPPPVSAPLPPPLAAAFATPPPPPPPLPPPPAAPSPAAPPVSPWVEQAPAGAVAAPAPPPAPAPLFGVEPPPPLPSLFAEAHAAPSLAGVPETAPVESGPPPGVAGAPAETAPLSEMERLRAELESERQLVERLREAKVKLEHRVSDAEAALEERRPRKRSSVLGRLLNPGEDT